MKKSIALIVLTVCVLSPAEAKAKDARDRPFKLLTVETAHVPSAPVTLGLTELGYSTGNVFVNTNPLMDLGLTGNVGLKVAIPISGGLSATVGARYIRFLGTSTFENYVKNSEPAIQKFSLEYQGFSSFLGVSLPLGSSEMHVNFQYAKVSTSQVTSGVAGVNIPFGSSAWAGLLEGGYDVHNRIPRASVGLLRHSESWGMRLGATYVGIKDPSLNASVLPVVDVYWFFGS